MATNQQARKIRDIKGVTLYRPWAPAVAYLGKDIENRSWACPMGIGDYLAIHSGATWDYDGIPFIQRHGKKNTATAIDWEIDFSGPGKDKTRGHIIAVAEFGGNLTGHPSPWFTGPIGWKLNNVVAIEPVLCPGQKNLWDLPENILLQVRTNFGKALKGEREKAQSLLKDKIGDDDGGIELDQRYYAHIAGQPFNGVY
jgi:hypothetical protein